MNTQDSVASLERLLEARLQEWHLSAGQPRPRAKSVIAITREAGCGAEAIAEKLSAALGWHLYSSELVEHIAKDAHVSTRLVAALDEHARSELDNCLAEFEGGLTLTTESYLTSLRRVLFAIATHGNAVIVGRGSNFFLPPDKRIGLSLVAPLEVRIKNTMKELGVPEKEASAHIARLDAEHGRLVKKYFQEDVRNPTHYHLVINTALVKPETIVHLVKALLVGQAPERP